MDGLGVTNGVFHGLRRYRKERRFFHSCTAQANPEGGILREYLTCPLSSHHCLPFGIKAYEQNNDFAVCKGSEILFKKISEGMSPQPLPSLASTRVTFMRNRGFALLLHLR